MTPAEQVGGDYYDYYKVGEDRWIAIGDVTGHGLNSGLLMLMAQTGFSTYLNSTSTPDTVELFKAVNRTLHNNMATRTKQNLYMTFTALRADSDGNFEHVGKHEDILVWRKATGKVEIVTTEGGWMGIELRRLHYAFYGRSHRVSEYCPSAVRYATSGQDHRRNGAPRN